MSRKQYLFLWLCYHFALLSMAQEKRVFHVDGPNAHNLYDYLRIWIDTTKNANFEEVAQRLRKDTFAQSKYRSKRNLGLNPYSSWYYLKIKNSSSKDFTYWWSFYTHADSIYVYRKQKEKWLPTDTLFRNQLLKERKVPTRALTIPVVIKYNEEQEIVVKLINKMKKRGYIDSEIDPKDNRKYHLMLSQKAIKKLPVLEQYWIAGEKALEELLGFNTRLLEGSRELFRGFD